MTITNIKFKKGTISGQGQDEVGKFQINGHISPSGELEFTKAYEGKHTVHYKGQRSYRVIRGHWSIPQYGISDAFEISKITESPDSDQSD